MRTKWWPQPHSRRVALMFELDNAVIDSTILPIAFYDEGLGTPSALETNPENAAFAISTDPNCFVGSRVNLVTAKLRFALTSKAIDDNIPSIRMAFMPLNLSFLEDYTAVDELTSIDVKDVLELQTESTDRQGGALYAGTDIPAAYTGSDSLGTGVPFLTVDDNAEGVAFNANVFYNAIHYHTIAGKLKTVQRGLKWLTLTPNRPIASINIRLASKSKRMNPYNYFGVLVHVPAVGNEHQNPVTADITAATNYVRMDFAYRYNEWNQDFNFKKI